MIDFYNYFSKIYLIFVIYFMTHMKKVLALSCLTILLSGCFGGTEEENSNNGSSETPKFESAEANLAQCLADKGVKMYGTTWCSHCNAQKEDFGAEAKGVLPFIDCEKEQATCQKAGIQGYPTWKFSDGSKLPGRQDLTKLAKKTACEYTPTAE
jgi:hypothetical protein